MKKILYILLSLFFFSLFANAQTTDSIVITKKMMIEYESMKKEKATAIFDWVLIPGGATLYSGSQEWPWVLISGMGLEFWLINTMNHRAPIILPFLLLVEHRIMDILISFDEIDRTNRQILLELKF